MVKKIILASVILIFCALLVTCLYSTDNFIKSEFKYVTGIDMPSSGKIIHEYKSASDLNGDLESCAVIEFNDKDFAYLMAKFNKLEHNNHPNAAAFCDAKWSQGLSTKNLYHIQRKSGGYIKQWSVLPNNSNQMYILYSSW